MLNGLGPKWGKQLEVAPNDQALLTPVGFDPAAQRDLYRADNTFGVATPTQLTLMQQFQMQLGARYAF